MAFGMSGGNARLGGFHSDHGEGMGRQGFHNANEVLVMALETVNAATILVVIAFQAVCIDVVIVEGERLDRGTYGQVVGRCHIVDIQIEGLNGTSLIHEQLRSLHLDLGEVLNELRHSQYLLAGRWQDLLIQLSNRNGIALGCKKLTPAADFTHRFARRRRINQCQQSVQLCGLEENQGFFEDVVIRERAAACQLHTFKDGTLLVKSNTSQLNALLHVIDHVSAARVQREHFASPCPHGYLHT